MGVIGGVMGCKGQDGISQELMEISRAQLVRGGIRGAYIDGGVALYSAEGIDKKEKLPVTVKIEEKSISAVWEGEIYIEGFDGEDCYNTLSGGKLAIEKYRREGMRFCESLGGSFALALSDGVHGELILLRDPSGSRPLYYIHKNGHTVFASEIKGLLAVMGEGRISLSELKKYIFSSAYICGDRLISDIRRVPASGGCVCTRLGVREFYYNSSSEENRYFSDILPEEWYCPTEKELIDLLADILYAFDYPQFDHLMPSFIMGLSRVRADCTELYTAVEDGSLCMSIEYSRARKDRLCGFYGVTVGCVPPSRGHISDKELYKLERLLWSILKKTDDGTLKTLFGEDLALQIQKQRNRPKRIRLLGMLCQIPLWLKMWNLRLEK